MASSVVVPSKAPRCRTQLPGRTCVRRCGLDVPRLVIMVEEHCNRWRQWFVRWGSMPARFDISFIMLLSVVVPRGALKNQILTSAGFILNFLL